MIQVDSWRCFSYVFGTYVSGMSIASGLTEPTEISQTLLETKVSELLQFQFDVTVSDGTTLIGCGFLIWRSGFDVYKFWKTQRDKKKSTHSDTERNG